MADTATDFLEHFGVKGMRWGKRNVRPAYSKSVKTFGSHNLQNSKHNAVRPPVNADARNSQSYQARAKAGGTQALSTKELKTLVERMNLEKQYAGLNPPKVSAGQKIMSSLLPAMGSAVASQYSSRQPQRPTVLPGTELATYAKPSTKKLVMDIALAAGKQVLQEQGLNIGMQIAKSLL